MEYIYNNHATAPDLADLTDQVAASAMTNKNLTHLTYLAESTCLKVQWDSALDAGDKTILDGIMGA